MLGRDPRFVLDNNLVISAIKSGWKRSTDLLFAILLSDAAIFVNKELLFVYEKYINRILGMPHLFLLTQNRSVLIDPSTEALSICRPFFPESEFADIVHAATCLEAEAVLISNDTHFNKIKKSSLIQVWSISEAIRRVL